MLYLVSGFGKDGNFSCWNLLHFSVNGVGVVPHHLVQLLGLIRPNRVLFYSILFFFSVEYISSRFWGKNISTWKKALVTLKAQSDKSYKQRKVVLHVNLSM